MDNATKSEAEIFDNRLKNVWQFLKMTEVTPHLHKKSILIKNLPWYLLIGASNAGKTQFIKQAGLKLIPANHLATEPRDESENNKHCNFWFTDEATIIDIPGNYLTTSTDENTNTEQNLFFLDILKKYTQQKPLNAILVAINLVDWVTKSKTAQQNFAQQLKQTLHNIAKKLNAHCPVYLIMTHADCIVGFNEFFSELGQEEREQPWGLAFNTQTTTNNFKINYDRLLKRLHERVIWRLQLERNADRRAKIQGFPLQIETLKESLANCIYQLSDVLAPHGSLTLEGVYFVSNLQSGTFVNCLRKSPKSISPTTDDKVPTLITSSTGNAYFSKRLLKKIILEHPLAIKIKQPHPHLKYAYAGAAGLILLSTGILAYAYNSKTTTLNLAHVALAEYRESIQNIPVQDHDLNRNLAPLQHLQQAVKYLQQTHLPWLIAQSYRQPSLLASTQKTYAHELNVRFLPSIGATLEQILQTNQNPDVLYGALKTYLMLGTPHHLDQNFIQHWLNSYWQQAFNHNAALQQQLVIYLNDLLSKPIVPLTLNQTIITQARNALSKVNPAQLAYAILKNRMAYTPFNPLLIKHNDVTALKAVFPNIESVPGVASIYTANQFQTIYFQQIKQACDLASMGDWVIGKRVSTFTANDLIRTVKTLYLKDYAQNWQAFLNSLVIPKQQTGTQLNTALNQLLGHNSPLVDVLKTVAHNTTLAHLLPANQSFPNEELQNIQINLVALFNEINHFTSSVDGQKTSELNQSLLALRGLQNYLNNIAHAKNGPEVAYTLAKNKFTHITQENDPIDALLIQAEMVPQPIQNWLTTLANNGWHYVLHETGNYLNDTWQKEVLPEYNTQIANRYPIFKNAKTDIGLEPFIHFFGPTGTIHNYFKNYLAPFVNTNTPSWQWRSSHGDKINLNNNFLMQLERAAIIKTMFFNNPEQLQVKFYLQLESLSPGVKQLQFTLDGTTFTDKKSTQNRHAFTWPAIDKSSTARIVFTDHNDQQQTLTFNGVWALFKLLDKSLLNADEESDRHFQITFNFNGQSARYDLIAANVINPFMPDIINEFRCPTTLK